MPQSRLNDRTLIPIFHLPTKNSEVFDSSDYKRKKNLVLLFLTQVDSDFFLKAEDAYKGLKEENAELVVICPFTVDRVLDFYRKNRLTYNILADEKKEVFAKFVSFKENEPVAALFITDKFGEVFFHYVEEGVEFLPSFEDIVKSLDFIESQCPECEGGV